MKYVITKTLAGLLWSILSMQTLFAQTWVAKANIQQSASGRGATQSFVLNNKLYVAGGYVGFTSGYTTDMQMFDPTANTWTTKTSPTEPNRSGGVAFVINGKAYVGLGAKNLLGFSPPQTLLTDLNEYNEASNTWTTKTSFPDSGRVFSAVFVLNNKAYVVGGEKGTTSMPTSEVWQYDPSTNTWTKKNDFPGIGIAYASAFTVGGKAYVVGGVFSDASLSNKTYEYDATNDTWIAKADLPSVNQGGVAFVVGNDAYYGLGSNKTLGGSGAVFTTTFYKYNATANTWTASPYNWTAAGRLWSVAGVINNKVYVGAGYKYQSGEFAYKDLFELAFTPNGVNDLPKVNPLLFYPNPAKDILFMNTNKKESTVEIYTLTGQLIFSKEEAGTSIDIKSLASGEYVIVIKNDEGIYKEKLHIVR